MIKLKGIKSNAQHKRKLITQKCAVIFVFFSFDKLNLKYVCSLRDTNFCMVAAIIIFNILLCVPTK